MAVPDNWVEHRRGDGERLGWIHPAGTSTPGGFIAVHLLGRPCAGAVDWLSAEESLESAGIGYLADPYELQLDDGSWLRVRITQVSDERIRVKRDDWGSIDVPLVEYTLDFPIPPQLRTVDPEAPVERAWI